MNRKALLALFVGIAAALPQVLPLFLTPHQTQGALTILSAIGAIVTGVMKFTDTDPPELPRPTGESGLDMSAIDEDDGA